MIKEEIAGKLGWEVHSKEVEREAGFLLVDLWLSPNKHWYDSLPDWENSLDAQARDIWPHLNDELGMNYIRMYYTLGTPRCRLRMTANPINTHTGMTLAQACWEAIKEVFND